MSASERYNRFGKRLRSSVKPKVVKRSYLGSDGYPNWLDDGNRGFDPKFPRTMEALKKGEKIIRYGGEDGYYAAPINTPYSQLALPYKIKTEEYNEYEVEEDDTIFVEKINVIKGIVGIQPSWPNEPGGGIQYYFPDKANHKSVGYYVSRGLRKLEVSEWSPLMEEDRLHP